MIQLNASAEDQLVAIYPEVIVSSSVDSLRFNYVQDYDMSSGSFDGDILSKKQWVVATVSGSVVPAYTGQYTFDIYELIPGAGQVWNLSEEVFSTSTVVWNEGTADLLGQLLTTERGYVVGTNDESITTYNSPNQNGAYTTYNS